MCQTPRVIEASRLKTNSSSHMIGPTLNWITRERHQIIQWSHAVTHDVWHDWLCSRNEGGKFNKSINQTFRNRSWIWGWPCIFVDFGRRRPCWISASIINCCPATDWIGTKSGSVGCKIAVNWRQFRSWGANSKNLTIPRVVFLWL